MSGAWECPPRNLEGTRDKEDMREDFLEVADEGVRNPGQQGPQEGGVLRSTVVGDAVPAKWHKKTCGIEIE